jgi:hypothetical protein
MVNARQFVYIAALMLFPQHFAKAETFAELAAQVAVTPEAIVASQASDKSAMILSRLGEAIELRAVLSNLQMELHSCELQLEELDRNIANGDRSTGLDLARELLLDEYHDTATEMAGALTALRAFILQDLDEDEIERMESWQASASHDVPVHLRIQSHTDQEWEAIELALRAQARSVESGEALSTEEQAIISSLSNVESALAQTQLACCLAAVIEQFEGGIDH